MINPEVFQSMAAISTAIQGITDHEYSKNSNSVWGVVDKNGELEKCAHTNCFAASSRVKKGAKFFINRIQHNGVCQGESRKKYRKDLIKFYDLLFNESIWADVFITKSGEEALDTGFMVARTDVPSNKLIQAMQAARIPTEYSNTMWAFNDLTDAGVNPKLAFLIGMMMRGGDYREGTVDFANYMTAHQCMSTEYITAENIRNMYEGNMVNANPNFDKNPDYTSEYSIFAGWGGGDGKKLSSFIADEFKPKEILGVEPKAVSLNPFKRPEKRKTTKLIWDYDMAIKAMVIFSERIEKEFINA